MPNTLIFANGVKQRKERKDNTNRCDSTSSWSMQALDQSKGGEGVGREGKAAASGEGQGRGTYRAVPAGEAAGIGPFSTVVTKQK